MTPPTLGTQSILTMDATPQPTATCLPCGNVPSDTRISACRAPRLATSTPCRSASRQEVLRMHQHPMYHILRPAAGRTLLECTCGCFAIPDVRGDSQQTHMSARARPTGRAARARPISPAGLEQRSRHRRCSRAETMERSHLVPPYRNDPDWIGCDDAHAAGEIWRTDPEIRCPSRASVDFRWRRRREQPAPDGGRGL